MKTLGFLYKKVIAFRSFTSLYLQSQRPENILDYSLESKTFNIGTRKWESKRFVRTIS